ncbi:MAG TPA: DNA gyrase inhibitor YacG [Candidatus Acidoferrales bacterium]|nr:DNA gyrase inhibitor YacG [Candidatus Acidoferrales bacterium]
MTRLCPICRKPVDSETDREFPFCSERCRLIDLGNWSSEEYKISEPVIDESAPDEPRHDSERDAK